MAPGEAEAPPPMPAESDLPPPPELPPIAKGESPPAAVLGVLGVPEVMRASTAAQAVEKVIGERRSKLNDDAQKEQQAWRDMQQALANDRAKLTPDQIRARERALQERITNAQRTFRERNRVIQEAAQYALAQIERTLVTVIRQVAGVARHEPGAAPLAGGAERQPVRHHPAGGRAAQQGAARGGGAAGGRLALGDGGRAEEDEARRRDRAGQAGGAPPSRPQPATPAEPAKPAPAPAQ